MSAPGRDDSELIWIISSLSDHIIEMQAGVTLEPVLRSTIYKIRAEEETLQLLYKRRKNVITFTFHDFSSLNIYVTNTQILKYNICPPMLMSSVVTTGHCVLLLSDWSAGPGQWVSWALIGQWQWSVVGTLEMCWEQTGHWSLETARYNIVRYWPWYMWVMMSGAGETVLYWLIIGDSYQLWS